MSTHTIISLRPPNVVRQISWQLDNKVTLGMLSTLLVLSLIAWIYLTQASAVATTSYHIDELRLELDQLRNQNSAIVLEIAQLEALSRVEVRAHELGFEPTTNVRYVTVDNYPISAREDVAPYRGSERARGNVDTYIPKVEPSIWWVSALDSFAGVDEKLEQN